MKAVLSVECSAQELFEDDQNLNVLFKIFWRLPLLFIATMIVRAVAIGLFNPLFKLAKSGGVTQEALSTPIFENPSQWTLPVRQHCSI